MKFTEAWANIAQKNVNLKVALCLVTVCCAVLCYSTVHLSIRDPIMIERGCYSKPILNGPSKNSPEEVKSFIKLALAQRFNSQTEAHKAYLSKQARKFKKREVAGFMKKNIKQSIIVNSIEIQEKGILVNTDRVLAVGQIRSAVAFPLQVFIESQTRTRDNPYGLILTRVKKVKVKKAKGGRKHAR